jgi:hypothetical protein
MVLGFPSPFACLFKPLGPKRSALGPGFNTLAFDRCDMCILILMFLPLVFPVIFLMLPASIRETCQSLFYMGDM